MFKRWLAVFILALTLLPVSALCSEAYLTRLTFSMTAVLARNEKSAVIQQNPGSGKTVSSFKAGDVCQVLGHFGKYCFVSFRGKTGYIPVNKLAMKGKEYTASPALREENGSVLSLRSFIPKRYQADQLELQGTIRAKEKLTDLFFFIWDARQLRVEKALFIPLGKAADTIPVSSFKKQLDITGITAGRKLLVIQGKTSGGEQIVLYRTLYSIRGDFREPAHITNQCKVSVRSVLNTDVLQGWTPKNGKSALTIDIPAGTKASLLTLEWKRPPKSFTVECYRAGNKLISKKKQTTGFYADAVQLPDSVRRVIVRAEGSPTLITVRLYGPRYASHAVQQWKPLPKKVDLMVITAHQDDELLFLGGTIPYYCAAGKTVAMMYLGHGGRLRYREALDGLWTAGLRYHPIFVNWQDAKLDTLDIALSKWRSNNGGQDPRIKLVRFIRQYRPEVIVTQDLNGEYGHNQHKLTAKLVAEAVKLSSNASFDPVSAKSHGTWQVKKLYLHLYKKNQIVMNWNKMAEKPFTAIMLAKEAYDKHRSQQGAFTMENDGNRYDNRKFGLYFTTVGPDVKKNDFFENIP